MARFKDECTIYFAGILGGGPIKIGHTKGKAITRAATLQAWCPYKIEILGEFRSIRFTEDYLLEMHASTRVQGEWVEPSESLSAIISHVATTGALPEWLEARINAAWKKRTTAERSERARILIARRDRLRRKRRLEQLELSTNHKAA